MTGAGAGRLALVLAGFTFLTACEEGQGFNLFDKPLSSGNQSGDGADAVVASAGTMIERDVESPEVFQETDQGLWDGRPSLGGVWIAHPNVADPERVIIRNEDNGKFIIGALFRRERENPGPLFQVSSDAAAELGMLAGAPANLNVTAMRREVVIVEPAEIIPAVDALDTPETIAEVPLATPASPTVEASEDPVVALAASAIEAATNATPSANAPLSAINPAPAAAATSAPAIAPTPAPATVPVQVSSLEKPTIQIGIYSIESNANGTADKLRGAGIIPTIKVFKSSGKTYWRVVVGPAVNKAERTTLLKKVQGLGYTDAYAVTN